MLILELRLRLFLPPGEISLVPAEGETVEGLLDLESEHEVMIISEEDEN